MRDTGPQSALDRHDGGGRHKIFIDLGDHSSLSRSCVVLYGHRGVKKLSADRFPACENCGTRMRISRRGVRYDYEGYYELQRFTCGACGGTTELHINTNGSSRDRVSGSNGDAATQASS